MNKSSLSQIQRWIRPMVWGVAVLIASFTTAGFALEIIREVEPDAKKKVQNQAMFQPDVLEQWLFNGQAKFSNARKNLDRKLDAKLKLIGRVCELTSEQKSKLRLAGAGDIHRFLRDCEKMRRRFDPTDRDQINNLWQEIQPLRNKFNSTLFSDDSMFERVQKQTLHEKQAETLEQRKREGLQFTLETAIHQLVSQFDNCAPLKGKDRDALTQLLLEKVPLPAALETPEQRQMAQQYVLYSCSKMSKTKLKAMFDDAGWKIFSQGMQNCRGYTSHFESIGMLK